MSVVGPEVMLNKYNLELKKKRQKKKQAVPVASQSHFSTSWEMRVLKPEQSLGKLCLVKIRLVQKEDDALCMQKGVVTAVLTQCSLLGDL